ncbi:P20L1 protein, partial [Polyodon spathula]|nr:P20L1 protein [Polyodon spathula]
MSKKPPNRPGIIFEIGARVDAQDYLQKWYPSRIEKIDYEEGKILVHFDRWSHRYDEWIFWDSSRLRPSERPVLRKEGLEEEEQEQEEQQQQQQQQEEEQEEEEEQEQGEQSVSDFFLFIDLLCRACP